jgi:tetratricopeptide (TPR) repeat protein
LDPTIGEDYICLAWIAKYNHDMPGAAVEYRLGARCDGHRQEALDGACDTLDHLGKFNESMVYASEAISRQPNDMTALCALADDLIQTQRFREAVAVSTQMVQYDQNSPLGHENLAEAYEGLGDINAAITEWHIVTKLPDTTCAAAAQSHLWKHGESQEPK